MTAFFRVFTVCIIPQKTVFVKFFLKFGFVWAVFKLFYAPVANLIPLSFMEKRVICGQNCGHKKGCCIMARKGESIYKRKDGRWEARYVKQIDEHGKKHLGSVYAKTYIGAKNKRIVAARSAAERPDLSNTAKKLTLGAVLSSWLEFNQGQIKKSSYQKYESLIRNHIAPGIGKKNIEDIDNTLLKCYSYAQLHKGNAKTGGALSAKTVNSILRMISSAAAWGEIANYSLLHPPYLKEERTKPKTLTRSEQTKLEKYIESSLDCFGIGVLLSLYTGMRIGEICALQREDLSPDGIYVHKTMQRIKNEEGKWVVVLTDPKTECSRRLIPIPDRLSKLLERVSCKEGFLLKQENGRPVEPRLLQKRFKTMLKRCGLPHRSFHSLRHTFATSLIEKGCDAKTVAALLGHSSVNITLSRYVHPSVDMKKKAVNMLEL